jgi:hypothetical protein
MSIAVMPPRFSETDLRARFEAIAASIDQDLIDGLIVSSIVNEPVRRHYPSPIELLYRRTDGLLEPYDARRHGRWTSLGTRAHPAAQRDDALARAWALAARLAGDAVIVVPKAA